MAAPPSGSSRAKRTLVVNAEEFCATVKYPISTSTPATYTGSILRESAASAKKIAVRKSRFGRTLMKYGWTYAMSICGPSRVLSSHGISVPAHAPSATLLKITTCSATAERKRPPR